MKYLYNIQQVIIEQFREQPFYNRYIFDRISLDNAITGILGGRGIGKTTYLLHQVLTFNQTNAGSAFYVSADNTFFLTNSLIDVADYLYKETEVKLLCIDEIHKYPNWQQELKNIADIYKSIKILFTGSSMIDIIHSRFDLSRRVTLHYFGGLSFREYLEFTLGVSIEPISFDQLLSDHLNIASSLTVPQVLKHFRAYLDSGYYLFCHDFSLQMDKYQAIENVTQKVIYEDVALLHQVKTSSLQCMEKLYKFVLTSPAGELNVNKLANLLGKSYDQISEYVMWLEQAGLICGLYANKAGKALIRSPKKIYPENTSLMSAAYLPVPGDNALGKIRETFFVNQLKNARQSIFYSDVGDFVAESCIFEVGGKNKTHYQIQGLNNAYIVADDILIGTKNCIPLYLFGFLY